MKKICFLFFALSFLISLSQCSLTITDEKAIDLGKQWYPDEFRECHQLRGEPLPIDDPNFGYGMKDMPVYFQYPLIFKMPNDPNDYVILAWRDCGRNLRWKLLKTTDNGESFQLICQSEKPILNAGFSWGLRLVELTGDNIPELIWEGGNLSLSASKADSDQAITIWQWKNGCFINILPYMANSGNDFIGYLTTESFIEIDDLDGDNKAEIIVGPELTRIEDENGDVSWEKNTPGSVWRYDGIKYVKWYELDPNDPNPIYVPSLGAFHPSTIPFSELSNPGNGKISIFISDPAGNLTADDFAQNSFECNGVSLTFKKIWKNNKQPEENSANFEFVGVPVKQFVRKSQGEWQTNPSDPFILSPDQKMEYHFCGKYVELETNKALIFPQLKEKSEKFFSENPNKTEYFATIPIRAKFKNNKISQTSALICIKKTGNIAEKEKSQNTDSSKTTNPKQTEKK